MTGLEAASGSEVRLFAAAGPVLEDMLDHWEKLEARKTEELKRREVPEEPEPDEAIDRVARLLIAEALRGGARGFEVGFDRKGGYSKTHHFARPPLSRRIQLEVAKSLLSWFRFQLKQADPATSHSFDIQLEDGTRVTVERTESGPEGIRLQFQEGTVVVEGKPTPLGDVDEAIVSAAAAAIRSSPSPPVPIIEVQKPAEAKCPHPTSPTDVFCPLCGEPVW
jgi:hypothetical protein